jgi:uncharacterized protein
MKITKQEILGAIADDTLHLIIFPTEACNFRCVYCYETFQLGRMKPCVVKAIRNFLRLRMSGLKYIRISWFGGEPLLALDVIRAISHEVMALTKGNNGIAYSADMTTNSYLLNPSTCRELIDLGIRQFQISLDGTRAIHDKKRVLANGKGTFTRIWDNMKDFRKIEGDFTVLVRVHLAKDNYTHIGEFIRMYAKTFGKDKRFKLFLRPLSRLGCPQDASLPVLDGASGKIAVEELVSQARQLGIEPITTANFVPICYAVRLNSFAIRADGTINKCTVKLSHPENQVGRINADGSLRLDRDRLLKWARGLTSGDRNELACPLIDISRNNNRVSDH